MKAIVTKYLGPTNTRGGRIKAFAEGVPSVTIPYSYEGDTEDCHRQAATILATRNGWLTQDWHLATGALPPSMRGYCHVFVKRGGAS